MMRARTLIIGAIGAAAVIGLAPPANAQDFLSSLFGAFGGGGQATADYGRSQPLPYASEGRGYEHRARAPNPERSVTVVRGSGQAFCVRTCDGRYFPISASDSQTKAASCNNFCPASETKVFYGSTIDDASTDTGKQYSALPNAFKYRTELVAGCTCNGKDQIGLAPVKIEDDPTLRKGDIIAVADGLMVNRGPDRRGASLNLSPASASIRAKYERLPVVVASE